MEARREVKTFFSREETMKKYAKLFSVLLALVLAFSGSLRVSRERQRNVEHHAQL